MNTTPTTPTRERLCDIYPSQWWPWLIPVCSPITPHQHGGSDCTGAGKIPIEKGWNKKAAERAEYCDIEPRLTFLEQHLNSGGNVGLALPPGIVVLDADDPKSAAWLVARYPDSPFQRTNAGGHAVFTYDPEHREIGATIKVEIAPGVVVDLRVGGKSQIVVEPSVHWTGALYEWGASL